MQLQAMLFTLSILLTLLTAPARAGTRDGGNGPVYLKCSELSGLTLHERRQYVAGERVRCIPDNTENPVPSDFGQEDNGQAESRD